MTDEVTHLRALLAEQTARAERAEAVLGIIESWTHTYGAALKPPRADTYGEGMCDAKDQVRRIIRSMS